MATTLTGSKIGFSRADYGVVSQAFQSMKMLSGDHISHYNYLDDLESFFWVFSHISFSFNAPGIPREEMPYFIQKWHSSRFEELAWSKLSFLEIKRMHKIISGEMGVTTPMLFDQLQDFFLALTVKAREQARRKLVKGPVSSSVQRLRVERGRCKRGKPLSDTPVLELPDVDPSQCNQWLDEVTLKHYAFILDEIGVALDWAEDLSAWRRPTASGHEGEGGHVAQSQYRERRDTVSALDRGVYAAERCYSDTEDADKLKHGAVPQTKSLQLSAGSGMFPFVEDSQRKHPAAKHALREETCSNQWKAGKRPRSSPKLLEALCNALIGRKDFLRVGLLDPTAKTRYVTSDRQASTVIRGSPADVDMTAGSSELSTAPASAALRWTSMYDVVVNRTFASEGQEKMPQHRLSELMRGAASQSSEESKKRPFEPEFYQGAHTCPVLYKQKRSRTISSDSLRE
ncbi:hypothetical protein OE88DRAFT_843932 [Heliocybe sulcata]|uniref:Fungal-type protein kinase domain-containing protein n=1 Tax=Heliocybe sulcata TaxID=5364 RepID=A0A5C3MQE7_9AGAM|nr:hypothetical protein OE88DRAFT_843932 [Heliocybe sulcata]